MKINVSKLWQENRTLLLFLLLMFSFRSAIADWSDVPTGSMKPTILEGDRILVDKMAYDIRLPFTHISLRKLSDPEPGDIIIFDSSVLDKRLVKRVIGVPGDLVAMKDNHLWINGEPLNYKLKNSHTGDRTEQLGSVLYTIRNQPEASPAANFSPIHIPEDYYLVLGDNRDNSADSRYIGLIPRSEIVGRSQRVLLSLNYDSYFMPRKNRFYKAL